MNLIYPETCPHIAAGELREIERIELEMRVVSVEPPADYRYGKGPDVVRLCALCAGKLLGAMLNHGLLREGVSGAA